MIHVKRRLALAMPLLISTMLSLAIGSAAADSDDSCADGPLKLGFYAFFDPLSYSADDDPESPEFNSHLGYEADLLTALETMEGAGLAFERQAIPQWDDIWLGSATPEYDIVGGGITILDSRRFDDDGEERVRFTAGHITFQQTLLVRAEDSTRLSSYDKLSSDVRVGVLAGTTGESMLLQITGLTDSDGILAAGTMVETPSGTVSADGSDSYIISAGYQSEALAERQRLIPPTDAMPQVLFYQGGVEERLAALADGEIDAIARGEIGNQTAARDSEGAFVVSAYDDATEDGGFTLALESADLIACLNEKIDWLTDGRRIGFPEWLEDPAVFMTRAELWNAREEEA